MSKIHRCDQGTAEWYELRLGIPTASMFHKIITPTGKPSAQASEYMYRLIAERLLNEGMEENLSRIEWIERGKIEEPNAAAQFAFTHNLELEPVGFVTSNDGRMGCSPDRLIKGRREAAEIKCPAPWTQIGYMLDGPGLSYQPQVQGQLLVGDFDKMHFYSWHRRMPPVYVVTGRDDRYIARLAALLDTFCDVLDAQTERVRRMGSFAAAEREQPVINPLAAG